VLSRYYQVYTCANAVEAKVKQLGPAVIICDIRMPGHNSPLDYGGKLPTPVEMICQ
jgi:DNA-binding NarL/FixJ family response regulator